MMEHGGLAYVFWHWRRSTVDAAEYEGRQRDFHAALAANPPVGFVRSTSAAVTGAPWANNGGEAYQDRYFISSSAALDELDHAVGSGRRRMAHDGAAAVAAGGIAGLYHVRLGEAMDAPALSSWFSKPAGMTYEQLFAELAPIVEGGQGSLWMRKLVLGPTPEFCLDSLGMPDAPRWASPRAIPLRPVWPE